MCIGHASVQPAAIKTHSNVTKSEVSEVSDRAWGGTTVSCVCPASPSTQCFIFIYFLFCFYFSPSSYLDVISLVGCWVQGSGATSPFLFREPQAFVWRFLLRQDWGWYPSSVYPLANSLASSYAANGEPRHPADYLGFLQTTTLVSCLASGLKLLWQLGKDRQAINFWQA